MDSQNTLNASLPHSTSLRYNHMRWEAQRRVLRFLLRTIGMTLLVKLDGVEGIENVPAEGPAILYINHIAFVDPLVVVHVVSRNIVPLAKIEVYNYPLIGLIPRIWGVIPVRREEFDRRAVQQALEVLQAGEIVLIAPEGTRRPALAPAKEGIAYLGARSGAPLIPTAIWGTVGFPALRTSRRWKQPGVQVRFGKPFRYHPRLRRPTREELRLMTDEAMYVLAALLPPELRGVYGQLDQATQTTLEWL
ncbi:MAG: lysophospholipid acyltransferase family protein [Anaerolineales bacterium]|nr:1-acyl-sn-glycerol-3-phosphate acyltransferase [Anaerolineales bacterium]MCS7247557.1 1-acyl-sn-glycerol-3-phosphate acyltransferase [Anaerolineales bacterium]MDW8161368.1 lysophospholipid acyltransferase family protein [Anaerolineales bacterium]MDW8447975.1 lysophospholipid acyltransferase family protein [Anaerolineales bacterium]